MIQADSQLQVENINPDTGKAPETRIESASDGQALVSQLVLAGRERSRVNAKIKGQMDGNPPYSDERLRNAGQAYRANINFGEAKAAMSSALVPYYDLFAGATTYFNVRCDYGGPDDREYFSGIVTEEFDRLLKSWYGFDFNVQSMLYDFCGFGKGFLVWGDKTSWRFSHAPHWRVLVPDGTAADVEKLEILIYRERMRVNQLWNFIRNKKVAKESGWNIEATVRAIANAFPENVTGSEQYNYELVQQKLKDKDLIEGARCSTVPVAHIYVREFDNKVSHYMVVEEGAPNKGSKTTKTEPEFLFEDHNAYENFQQGIAAFFLETLDGSWNGASGLGKDIYSAMAIKDRLKCSFLDGVFLRCGIALQARTGAALQKAALVQAGVFNIIPDGYDVQQATLLGDIASAADADVYLDNVIASNTGVYKQRQMKTQGNPITAEQARLDQMNSMVLGNSSVNRFYSSLDKLGAETYRRACLESSAKDDESKAARDFRQRCYDRGVPKDALKKTEYVRAYRNVGNGSIQMRQMAIKEFFPFLGMLNEEERQNYKEDAVAAIFGHAMVDRYASRDRRQKLPNDHEAQALLENAAIKIGAPVAWTPTQNNVVHAQTHLQAATQALNSLGQGANPVEVLAFADGIGAHTAVHLQSLASDTTRKQEYQLLSQQLQQLAALTDKLKAKVRADQKAAMQQQMEQAANQKQTLDEMQLKQLETAQEMKHKQEKHDQQMKQSREKTTQKLVLNDATTAAKIANQHQESQAASQQ